jgi:hypothetical protein
MSMAAKDRTDAKIRYAEITLQELQQEQRPQGNDFQRAHALRGHQTRLAACLPESKFRRLNRRSFRQSSLAQTVHIIPVAR